MKYVAMAALNAPIDGQVVRLEVGQEFEAVTAPVDLLRAGYVRPVAAVMATAEDAAAAERKTATAPKKGRGARGEGR